MVRGWTLPLLLLMLQGSCSTGATELVEARHPPVLPQTEATLSGLLLRHPDMQPRWDQEQVRGPSLQLFDWTVLVGGGLQERQQPRDSSCSAEPTPAISLPFLDTDALMSARVRSWPGDHIFVPNFVRPAVLRSVTSFFPPSLQQRGAELSEQDLQTLGEIRGSFRELLRELHSPYLKLLLAIVFNVDLQRAEPHLLVREGTKTEEIAKAHALVSVRVYLSVKPSPTSGAQRGGLRLVNSDQKAVEFTDVFGGNLIAFKVPQECRDRARWCGEHGYRAYEGPRREIQLDYRFPSSRRKHRDAHDGGSETRW